MDNNTMLVDAKFSNMLSTVQNVKGIEEIVQMIKKVKALETLLKGMDVFKQQSIKYAKLHAETLVKYIELGGHGRLRGQEEECAKWLASLTPQERDRYIAMCDDGLLITAVFRREVLSKSLEREALDRIKIQKSLAIEELEEKGKVDFRYYTEVVSKEMKKAGLHDQVNDVVCGFRNKLLAAGAVGTGENSGLYILPGRCDNKEFYDAIGTRARSICADLKKLLNLLETSEADAKELRRHLFETEDKEESCVRNEFKTMFALAGKLSAKLGIETALTGVEEKLRALEGLVANEDNKEYIASVIVDMRKWLQMTQAEDRLG